MLPTSKTGYSSIPTYPSPSPPTSPLLNPQPPAAPLSYGATVPAYPPPPGPGMPPAPTPASPSPAARAAELLSRVKDHGKNLVAAQRPWPQLLNASAFGRPVSSGDALTRLRRNLGYFRSNYALVVIAILALGLLWHPGSLFAFLILGAAWFFFYFARNEPIVLFNRAIDDTTVLGFLSAATVIAFIFTDVGSSVFGSVMTGLVLVGLHAVFRRTDDLPIDEREAASGGLVADLGVPVAAGFSIPVQQQAYVRVV